jgi:hypothetical protein
MNESIAIVVVAFNRLHALQRLLASIANANYSRRDIPLIISIDYSNNPDIELLAESFNWLFGEKIIMRQTSRLGLKEHILQCGDLTTTYNSIIILEDDLAVSPYFFEYAVKAKDFYKNDSNIAGISLYNYQVTENGFYPFHAIDDSSDTYFMQVASSWGQLFTNQQWQSFRAWLKEHPKLADDYSVPNYLKYWGKHSWKKHYIHYLIVTDKYFVFPRLSLSTNFGDPGTNASSENVFHVPLQISSCNHTFQILENSLSVYDAWFEIKPFVLSKLNPQLQSYNYEVDIYGTKEIASLSKPYVLTSKKGNNPILGFSKSLFPAETNIAFNLLGKAIELCKISNNDFRFSEHLITTRKSDDEIETLSIDFTITVEKYNKALLTNTLQSFTKNRAENIRLIIVTYKEFLADVKEFMQKFPFEFDVLLSEEIGINHLITKGLHYSTASLICWLNAGCILSENSIDYVRSIFYNDRSINWISGISEKFTKEMQIELVNLKKYRLTSSELYHQLKNSTFEFSLEGNFLKTHCFNDVYKENITLFQIFTSLLENYQLRIALHNFIEVDLSFKNDLLLTADEKKAVLTYLRKTIVSYKPSKKLRMFLLNIISDKETKACLYANFKKLPDILRFDDTHQKFYNSTI